uniref:RING-type domain-containing protein n=1 Tax=Steinernema glaseri TaxID=37863 RepID=A0A1I7Z4G3_9BILA
MLSFDDHARPLMYMVLLKVYKVPTWNTMNRNGLPYWTWYYKRLTKAHEYTEKRRGAAALRALRDRPNWGHRQEFIRRFNTDDPERYFSEDPSRISKEIKEYVLRAEHVDSPLFSTGTLSDSLADSFETEPDTSVEGDGDDLCIICLGPFVESHNNKTSCLYCRKPFHGNCMMRWMNQSTFCPHCRSESWVNVNDLSQDELTEYGDRGSPFSEYTVTSLSSDGNDRSNPLELDEFRDTMNQFEERLNRMGSDFEERLNRIESMQQRLLTLLERNLTR